MKHFKGIFGWMFVAVLMVAIPLVLATTIGDKMTFSNTVTVEGTDQLTANSTRNFSLPLVAAFIDGTGVVGNDGTTAPGIATTDAVPKLVWASSAETGAVQWSFRVPSDYSTGLVFYVIGSSAEVTGSNHQLDWSLWVNKDGTAFDAASHAQTAVAFTEVAFSTKNDVLTLTADATALADLAAGNFVTLELWNNGTSDTTTEVLGVEAVYTAAR